MGRRYLEDPRRPMSSFVFTSEADAEIAEAFAWYEQRSSGLGPEFLRAVEVAVTSAAHAPLRYPVWRRGARRVLLHRFPFAIFSVHPTKAYFVS